MAEVVLNSKEDPALKRLHEVAERIRRRVSEGRPKVVVKVMEREKAPPPPAPHWSDGPDAFRDEPSPH